MLQISVQSNVGAKSYHWAFIGDLFNYMIKVWMPYNLILLFLNNTISEIVYANTFKLLAGVVIWWHFNVICVFS